MSLLEKATIITTPTAHSNGTLHSIKGGAVADFDVVRGSAATRVNAEGLIESVATNIPRIDYTTGEGVILTEPQSTNLFTYSEDFSQSSWENNAALNITSNATTSPSGETNATRVNSSGSGNRLGVEKPLTSGNDYTLSFYMKNNGGDASLNANFDGQLALQNYTITNEWARYEFTFTATITETSQIRLFSSAANIDAFVWGAQLEALPYSTSYIPTSGAIATRLADSVTGAGDATTFNDSEGVLYTEIAALADDETNREITLSDGSTTNYVLIRFNSGGSNRIYTRVDVGGAIQYFDLEFSIDITNTTKIAIRYGNNNFATFINGSKVKSQLSGIAFGANTLTELSFDNGSGAQNFFGKVKALAVFNEALTDSELECLTKI